jgi:large subunit ribosomal protein L6
MSRIGIKPLEIPEGVEVKIEDKSSKYGGNKVTVKGSLGELVQDFREDVQCEVKDGKVIFKRKNESKLAKSLHGLYRTLVSNMIKGVAKGFSKELEMVGIGYRAEVKGNNLELTAGATHPYVIEPPEGITFNVTDKVNIEVKGMDKQLVGQVAANIRSTSKPEPYKGKGIRYKGEYVRRKAGKAAKAEGSEE